MDMTGSTLHERIVRGLMRPEGSITPGGVCPLCGKKISGYHLKTKDVRGWETGSEQGEAQLSLTPCKCVAVYFAGVWMRGERTAATRIASALEVAARYADVAPDARVANESACVLDQMVRQLLDDGYDAWRAQHATWQDGIEP